MAGSTIPFEGVEIPDLRERKFPYSVIEVTRRCKTRFFFQAST